MNEKKLVSIIGGNGLINITDRYNYTMTEFVNILAGDFRIIGPSEWTELYVDGDPLPPNKWFSCHLKSCYMGLENLLFRSHSSSTSQRLKEHIL